MTLRKLDIFSVRNIHQASILPSPSLNLIVGPNASGKSSLLEAIFILARARSFRTSSIKQAIKFGHADLIVTAQVEHSRLRYSQLGIQMSTNGTCSIHIDRESKNRSDLAYFLPLQLIHPKSYRLLDAGPQIRRKFLDWGVFHLEPNFLAEWRAFNKVLSQRNAVLKTRQLNQLDTWNQEFVRISQIISDYRQAYLNRLESFFVTVSQYFLDENKLQLKFRQGWEYGQDLLQVLTDDINKDLRGGFTHSGPHRSDFQLLFNQRNAKDFVSRGQLKLLVLALKLAQVKLFNSYGNNFASILIDDIAAELDRDNTLKLIKYLSDMNSQVFMSSTQLADFGETGFLENIKVFHVERGCVQSF